MFRVYGYIGVVEKEMESTIVSGGYIGIVENEMETTIVYRVYIGILEKKMETIIVYSSVYKGKMKTNMKTAIEGLGSCLCVVMY